MVRTKKEMEFICFKYDKKCRDFEGMRKDKIKGI